MYPAALRDTLLRAAERDLYTVHWSEHILEELRRNLIADGRMSEVQWAHLRAQLTIAFPSALVVGYESLIASMANDVNDRHVTAAAVRSRAEVIVTANLRHFPDAALKPYACEAKSPDDFLLDLTSISAKAMSTILREQLTAISRKDPNATMDRLLQTLTKLGAPGFVETMRAVLSATE